MEYLKFSQWQFLKRKNVPTQSSYELRAGHEPYGTTYSTLVSVGLTE